MRFVIQKVSRAYVEVRQKKVASIEKGLLVLVGFHESDGEKTMDTMLQKLFFMRIFEDQHDKMNLSIQDVRGQLLLVSQFTLYADCKKGNRPSFVKAAPFNMASDLFDKLFAKAENLGASLSIVVQKGIFGESMQVSLTNDGPVTIILDSFD